MLNAQSSFSLKDCIEYAKTHHSTLKTGEYDIAIAQKRVNEQIGSGLPQITASGSLDDNLKKATQLMPAAMFGGPSGSYVEMESGTRYSMSAGVSLNQNIINPSFWIGLESARISKKLSEQRFQQSYEQVVYGIGLAYYQSMILQKQVRILQATLDASNASLRAAELRFANGMAKQTDIDRLRISFNNARSQMEQTAMNYEQSLNSLKFNLGMPVDSALILADTLLPTSFADTSVDTSVAMAVESRSDYRLQETNLFLSKLDRKKLFASTLPVLTGYVNLRYNAANEEFNLIDKDQKWYESSAIGLQLSMPLFSGLQTFQRIAQLRLTMIKAEETLKQTEQSIKVNVSNYLVQYKTTLAQITNESDNYELAKRVYADTRLEFEQGVSSTYNLVQAESSLREAQNNYFNKLLNFYIARIGLEQAKGTLVSFFLTKER